MQYPSEMRLVFYLSIVFCASVNMADSFDVIERNLRYLMDQNENLLEDVKECRDDIGFYHGIQQRRTGYSLRKRPYSELSYERPQNHLEKVSSSLNVSKYVDLIAENSITPLFEKLKALSSLLEYITGYFNEYVENYIEYLQDVRTFVPSFPKNGNYDVSKTFNTIYEEREQLDQYFCHKIEYLYCLFGSTFNQFHKIYNDLLRENCRSLELQAPGAPKTCKKSEIRSKSVN